MAFSPLAKNASPHQTFHFHLLIFCLINTVILVIQDLVLTREKNTVIERENAQLKINNLEALNERLKQQIHPHFLFNSLSTLKALISTSPADAEEYLIKLSGFLRNSITANTLNAVKVSEELNACIDYLHMQKIRFGEALQFETDIPAAIKGTFYMPVFSMQILAENAIKHNAFGIKTPLLIKIACKEKHIVVSNNMQPRTVTETSAGTGLANLNERYKILSGEGILIKNDGNTFAISLKIFDNENCNNRG